jgi:hypothetical protein
MDDEINVTFTWTELKALLALVSHLPRDERTPPLVSAWEKLADAHLTNDPPERT